ncbi:MAG: efflux RND transporter permease subunit [Nitrospirales bacterium]|nr:efflux RND transporter permease subunit [Nitrospirales bacterium]MBA3965743.1 efflux RND transporter permease subunit [Nitrospirales bacterium]
MTPLTGVAAETGVIMVMFLNDACARRQRENRLQSIHDLREAIIEGAVLRVRPRIMTASAIILGFLPRRPCLRCWSFPSSISFDAIDN